MRQLGDILGDKNKKYKKIDTTGQKCYTNEQSQKRRKIMATQKKRVSISLTDEQFEIVQKMAKERGFSKTAIFVLALEEYLKNQK